MQMGGRGAVALAAGVMDNLIAVRPPRHLQPPRHLAPPATSCHQGSNMGDWDDGNIHFQIQVPLDGLCAIYILLFEQPSPCMAHGSRF